MQDIKYIVDQIISSKSYEGVIAKYIAIKQLSTFKLQIREFSLLPTHVGQLQGFAKILVALDPDASLKTLTYTRELRSAFPKSKILAVKLEDDLKYRRSHDMMLMEKLSQTF